MNASDRRNSALLLAKLCDKCRPSAASFLGKQLKQRFKKPIQREREAKEKEERLGRKGATDAIYEAVEKRAADWCECGCGRLLLKGDFLWRPELDEWLNGNGRRRQKRAVSTCWMLTRYCHRLRQRYAGGAPLWNSLFEKHCKKYGYAFQPHIEHAKLSPALAASSPTPLGPAARAGCVSQTKEQQ